MSSSSGTSRVDTIPEDFVKRLQERPLAPGDVIGGRYKLISALAEGAMGQVFVAENQAIGCQVAVKVLKPRLLADADFRERFQREAEAFAAIEHRNVARFLDLIVGDPTFLVMEFVRGRTLARRLQEDGPLLPLRAAFIVERLAWALEIAHQAGVIHRDIKPANVILAPDAENGEEPKLIDFGLAKLAAVTASDGLTRDGQIVGTPDYMSPEQIASRPVDARSDVYSLGCVLYEALTNRTPFAGEDVQLLYQQLHHKPEPVERFAPTTPLSLRAVLDRALQKDPALRFPSARAMAQALAAVQRESEKGAAAAPAAAAARRGWGLPLVAAILCAVVAAGAGVVIGRRRSPAPLAAPAQARGALIVLTRPAGARVEIDGHAAVQETPLVADGVSAGAHRVRLTRAGAEPVERHVQVAAGERTVVDVALAATRHAVEVRSIPEQANVYLDGQLALGQTPTKIDVSDDEFHQLRVEKTGYETALRRITPDDRSAAISVQLPPVTRPIGTVIVDSDHVASVLIDGVDTGFTTPSLPIEVPVGTHVVEVQEGQARARAKVTLGKGQTVRLLLTATAR
jgi:serine/threonine-protein kinase